MHSRMSQEVRFSHEKATQEGYGGKKVGKMDGIRVLANASGSTPTKLVTNSGCLLCGTIQSNSCNLKVL